MVSVPVLPQNSSVEFLPFVHGMKLDSLGISLGETRTLVSRVLERTLTSSNYMRTQGKDSYYEPGNRSSLDTTMLLP